MSAQALMTILAGCCVAALILALRHDKAPFRPKAAKALRWALLTLCVVELGLVVFGAVAGVYLVWKDIG